MYAEKPLISEQEGIPGTFETKKVVLVVPLRDPGNIFFSTAAERELSIVGQ